MKEHETEIPYCWCKPSQKVVSGNIITLHNNWHIRIETLDKETKERGFYEDFRAADEQHMAVKDTMDSFFAENPKLKARLLSVERI